MGGRYEFLVLVRHVFNSSQTKLESTLLVLWSSYSLVLSEFPLRFDLGVFNLFFDSHPHLFSQLL